MRDHSASTVLKKPKTPRRKCGRHFLRPGTNGGGVFIACMRAALLPPLPDGGGGREILALMAPAVPGRLRSYRIVFIAQRYCIHCRLGSGLLYLRTAARWLASRARRAQRHHTCITSGGTSVISVFDEACRWAAGVRYGVTPGGVPERLTSRTPPRPNQIFADLIGPMAFITRRTSLQDGL